jgi:phosphatidylserine decarboxylase
MYLELAWGVVRRGYLRTFRPSYVRRMAQLRRGNDNPCPHDVLDPRDLKYFRNQGGYYWAEEDDPFRWRDRIPFARAGLAELLILGTATTALTVLALLTFPLLAVVPAAALGLVVWFFRDPERDVPQSAGAVVAPADGKVVAVQHREHHELIGGPAIEIGIFLSIFNVHVNRCPVPAQVVGLCYRHGKFFNAMRSIAARENQQLAVCFEDDTTPGRYILVRQISGAIARRIVCWLRPGDRVRRGQRYGMIKLGSRTEIVLPQEAGLKVSVAVGDRVKAGQTILAHYHTSPHEQSRE